ncbi:DUF6950 family protein [Magnetospirillum aberrantis]|uniref:DUF6950 domain-containing protein n=1 Tax=Magnetospirillum aberrantis SpK TaxID=908842 RepID=A0A7C9UVX0_9PROT|nr:hypothetical protein [Magnetospirillum aberrantis]NFV79990.1 hypothetical protein [Magnetospirillum aberrantis SpK]
MSRIAGWERRLSAAVEAARGRAFERGVFDCCIWPADVVRDITGIDGAEAFRGRYRSRGGAIRALARFSGGGGLLEVMRKLAAQHGWAEIAPLLARRGDVCLTSNDEGLSLAICVGAEAATPVRAGGLEFVPLERCSVAWRIG